MGGKDDPVSLYTRTQHQFTQPRITQSTSNMARTPALLALAIICAAAAAKQAADRVLGLPGQPSAGFEQYAGYVTVNETHGRALFYWFIEAAAGGHKKPLELGPFLIQKGKPELHRNPESWNKASPARDGLRPSAFPNALVLLAASLGLPLPSASSAPVTLAMAPETRAMKKQKTGVSSSVQLISSGSSSSGGDNGSRSRSPSPHSGGDGDTVDSGEHSSDSVVSVPKALLAEPDWCGYAADAHVRCHCSKRAVRKANLLFLESTAGVGFSYTNTSQDLDQFGDSLAVEDMHKVLIRWFKRFPNLKGHEFYVAGESYAGHQVSQLADKILAMNKGRHRINLKGIMIGNPSLDRAADDRGIVESAWHHAVMSDDMYDNITRACDHFTDDTGEGEVSYQRKGDPCEAALGAFFDTLRDINQYTLYSSTCTNAGAHRRHHGLRYIGYDPCARNYTREYLNRADVQRALHANATRNNARLFDNWRDSPASVLPVIKKLVDASLRIWLYSGDMDVRLKTLKRWRKWFAGGVVAGDTVVYKGLVYATVRGAGMAVSRFARAGSGPEAALPLPRRQGATDRQRRITASTLLATTWPSLATARPQRSRPRRKTRYGYGGELHDIAWTLILATPWASKK
ncbi:hypothetical protein EJB05_00977, partial [Eragrostis curvula]